MQSALIVAQTAMVVVLLAAAGLLIRSYIKVETVDTGFSQSTVTFHLTLDGRYKPQQAADFYRKLMAKLEALPGVQAAGAVNDPAAQQFREHRHDLGGWIPEQGFSADRVPKGYARLLRSNGNSSYCRAVLSTKEMRHNAGNTIINQTFAKTYFPNRNPIGGRISGDPRAKLEDGGRWSALLPMFAT